MDAVHGVRLVSTDRTVAVTLHPTLLVLRATYPLRLNRRGSCTFDSYIQLPDPSLHQHLIISRWVARRSEAPWNPQPPTLRHHYAWVTQEFPSTAVPEWLQGALALCVIAACEAGLVPSPALEPHQDTTPSPKDSLSSIQHFLARWAPGALAASPRFVELPTCQATYSRAAPPGAPADRATVTADTNGEALSSWPGHPSGSWWASPATVTWPGDAVLVAEWTPQGTQLLVPVPSSDLGDHGQGEVGPDAMQAPVVGGSSTTGGVEALTVMHEDGSLLLTSGAGRYVLHVPPGESRPRLHLSNALPDRVATGAPVLGDTFAGVGPRWADLDDEGSSEGVRMRQGTVALGPCASRLLALRGVAESAIRLTESTTKRPSRYSGSIHDTPGPSSYGGTASGRERWVMAGDAYVEAARFPSAFVEHPVAGRKVAYHRPGGGPLGYPGPWHGVAGAGGDERVAPASEAQAKGYFSSAGSYRERYEMGKDEGVVEMGFDPAVGHFTAFADGRVQVRFVDAAVAWVEPDGVLCRVVLPGGGPPRAVSTARPIGVEAYVTAAMEFRGWALQGPTGRAAALRAQRAVAAELSRIQRQVAIVQSGWRPS